MEGQGRGLFVPVIADEAELERPVRDRMAQDDGKQRIGYVDDPPASSCCIGSCL